MSAYADDSGFLSETGNVDCGVTDSNSHCPTSYGNHHGNVPVCPIDSRLQNHRRRRQLLALLAIASTISLFSDTSYLPIFAIFQPAFFLAYFRACSRSNIHWCTKYIGGWIVYSVCRAFPASDYFYNDNRIVAYVLGLAVIFFVYGAVMIAATLQCRVWLKDDARVASSLDADGNVEANGGLLSSRDNGLSEDTPRERQDTPMTPTTTLDVSPKAQPSNHMSKPSILDRPNVSPLIFPILFTTIYQLLFRFSPIGGAGNPAMGLSQVFGLRQVVSVLGEIFLVFWIGWLSSIIVGVGFILGGGGWFDNFINGILNKLCICIKGNDSTTHLEQEKSKIPRFHLYTFYFVTFFMFVYGSARELVGRGMYLQPIQTWSTTQAGRSPLRVSCLTRVESSTDAIIKRTNERLASGDDLIVWSEAAVSENVALTPDLFDWENSGNARAVVVPTSFKKTENDGLVYNTMEIMQNGLVIAQYSKNRPVPVMEPDVLGGKSPPQSYGVTFTPLASSPSDDDASNDREPLNLATSMAICFDFDFPYLFRQASNSDLVIGASWYWASIGNSFWNHNIFRAIENGFTMIKCAEEGITGGVDPYGRTLVAIPSLMNEVHVMEIPVQKGITTFYSILGWAFGWICVFLSPLMLFLLMLERIRKECIWVCCRRHNYSDIPPIVSP